MAQRYRTPNPENASLADLQAVRKAGNKETDRRCLVIIMLLTGSTREQVGEVLELGESAIQKIVRAFNTYGADGLVALETNGKKEAYFRATERGYPRRIRRPWTRPKDVLDSYCFSWTHPKEVSD